MKTLITGAADFIGFHAVKHFAEKGYSVVGLDNINNHYNVELKFARLNECGIVNRLKNKKREMLYGRAGFELLIRKAVLSKTG